LLRGHARSVYQIGSSETNPCDMRRVTEFIGLYLHERQLDKPGSPLERLVKANREPVLVSKGSFARQTELLGSSLDMAASKARHLAGRTSSPRLRATLERLAARAESTASETRKAEELWELFLPFSFDQDFRFATAHIRELWEQLGEPSAIADLDWREYWLEIHIPGLCRHVLAEASTQVTARVGSRVVPARAALVERLQDVARIDGHRAALTVVVDDRPRTWTYAALWDAAQAWSGHTEVTSPSDHPLAMLIPILGALRAGVIPPVIAAAGLSARGLADRLAALGQELQLRERSSVVATTDARGPELVWLAALYAKAELWVASPEFLDGALAASGAEAAAIGSTPPCAPHRLRSVLDLAPEAGKKRLAVLRESGVAILAAERAAANLGGAVAGEDERAEPAHGFGDLVAKIRDAEGVSAATMFGNPAMAIVRPDLSYWRDFRRMRERLEALFAKENAEQPNAGRVAVWLVTLSADLRPDNWEARSDWIRIAAREGGRPDWSALPDDRVPLAELEEETLRLARGSLAPEDLSFVWDCHRSGPASFERLLCLERALIRTMRRREGAGQGGVSSGFNAQAFLQDYEADWRKTQSIDYRATRQIGRWLQRWRDWHRQEDPAEPLLADAVTRPVRHVLGQASAAFFEHAMDVAIRGQAYVPAQGSFVIVANHSSHLDTGVVKFALGSWGDRIRALAARDYFFKTPARRFAARHFTRLIPIDRHVITTEWIKQAQATLEGGDCVLIFPEGTRTDTPDVKPFKASLGTLLRACRAPVLPVFIEGTHAILPKGALLPKGRQISVHIGPLLAWSEIDQAGGQGGALARDRAIAAFLQDAVASLAVAPNQRRIPARQLPPGEQG
ncbi:MAG: 1-acyl-sn-glycerol-3-phosphate acyltransferase, partial [Cyanobacteria bacterium REEB65]|nr:1-acyl-sn-glycerol-3-phosphate acyltransferase [Cyanobacteria bacterium REEB65]